MANREKDPADRVSENVSARLTPGEKGRLDDILREQAAAMDAAGFPADASFASWLRWTIRQWRLNAPPGAPLVGPRGSTAAPPSPPVPPPAPVPPPVPEPPIPEAPGPEAPSESLAEAAAALPGHSRSVRGDQQKRRDEINGWVRDLAARFRVSEATARVALDRVRTENRNKGWRKEDIGA